MEATPSIKCEAFPRAWKNWDVFSSINLCRSDNSRNRILLLLYAHNMHEISEMWEAAALWTLCDMSPASLDISQMQR